VRPSPADPLGFRRGGAGISGIVRRIAALACEVTAAAELGASERDRWEAIRAQDPALASPFFAFDYTAAVASVRRDVHVAVLRDAGEIVGFLPFQRALGGAGRPVGGKLTDYQGAIVAPGLGWDVRSVLRGAGLRSLRFDHLIASQRPFRPYFSSVASSPVVDLDDPAKPPPGAPSQAARKRKRLERRSVLRFTRSEASGDALRTLMGWKAAQYRRTGAFDAMGRPWVRDVLERLHATRTDALAGELACLYADDELLAAHFGLRSGRVLHWWFPAYDAAFARDSPGLVLLRLLLDDAPEAGIGLLDFGKGEEDYKASFANDAIELGVGVAEADRFSAWRGAASRAAWGRALRSRLYRPVNHLRKRLDFR
jgi:CelD/BcsL family acetyltransferase involved in cellulose biosynthesis